MPELFVAEPRTPKERLVGQREFMLVMAGMELSRAHRLAYREDWRVALDLMNHGCPEVLAFEIAR